MTQPQQKNTRVKAPQKPFTPPIPSRPSLPNFQKPQFNTAKFNTSFRNQNRGSGGK